MADTFTKFYVHLVFTPKKCDFKWNKNLGAIILRCVAPKIFSARIVFTNIAGRCLCFI